jgi:4-hydroxythreonine-4-phosphate dehydrogenase
VRVVPGGEAGRLSARAADPAAPPPARLAVTLGDPRGIGPEIVAKAIADDRVRAAADLVIVGPRGVDVEVTVAVGDWRAGQGREVAGRLAGLAVERAADLARSGSLEGVVTAPLDKAALLAGGYEYPGHTEMLASLTGARVAMMLTAPDTARNPLRVVLATTHLPLRQVPDALTPEGIVDVATTTRAGLREWFGIADPRIALCALNPHAGDGGRFGREDDEVLAPAARAAGIAGPLPADTVFVRAMRGSFDAVIAPYHDVGMTAIKVAAFGSAVNVTLGLPFPRCSPDHGTALDIAGQGIADPSSMIESILLCARIAQRLRRRRGA